MREWSSQLNQCISSLANKAVQRNLNMFRKIAVNLIKQFKTRTDFKKLFLILCLIFLLTETPIMCYNNSMTILS